MDSKTRQSALLMPRLLIIGLDGVGLDLVEEFISLGKMPFLEKILERGTSSALTSVLPPTTLPAWTSIFTGASPSDHGIPDFTVRHGYRIRFIGASQRKLGTVFSHLEQQGFRVGAAWFPATYPPEPLSGYQISGWDSPVTHEGDDSFVHPRLLHQELSSRFQKDHLCFDAIDEFQHNDSWYHTAAEALIKHIHRRSEMAKWLLTNHPTDIAAFYFGEADTAAHHFWAFHDPLSPRRPPAAAPQLQNTLGEVYSALDTAVEGLVKTVGETTPFILVSDHGSGGTGTVLVHLNRMLELANLLRFKKRRFPLPRAEAIRRAVPKHIPRQWRRTLFRLAGGIAPSLVESQMRFQGIDWERTVAFSEEISYAPSIWFNQVGRERKGRLLHQERDQVTKIIADAAARLKDPEGRVLVKRIIPRHELHQGKYAHLFPDITIEFNAIDGYLPACMPSRGIPGNPVSLLPKAEHLGPKGRSMPGCHVREGIFVATGPGVAPGERIEARVEEVAAWICGMASAPPASWFASPQSGPFQKNPGDETAQKGFTQESSRSAYSSAEERVVAERLRRLGYLEG